MRGDGYFHLARNFGTVVARATGGRDLAFLSAVHSEDAVWGRDDWARARRAHSRQLVIGFDEVRAIAAPGETPTSNVSAIDYIYRQIGDWQ